ncbi:MAG: ThuA domain-containing protein [Planctomycetota bacterium]
MSITSAAAEKPGVFYEGREGPGSGKKIVLVSGDEEYRSEEALPQLGKILAVHHGFDCRVLFAINPDTGKINPNVTDNIPGLEALETADLMIIFTRFRHLPPDQMEHIVNYVESGRPVIGMRTATHAFRIPRGERYARYSFNSDEWPGGFGRQVLGETWIDHHGVHGEESTRGVIPEAMEDHPVTRGVEDIWGPTDVYKVRLPLSGDSRPVVLGQVLDGMTPDAEPVDGPKNDPMMPVAWLKTYRTPDGERGRVFTTTMGASQDLQNEDLRRLLVNAAYWAVGMENDIPGEAMVDIVGDYEPTSFGFGAFTQGMKPSDFALEAKEP